MSDIIVVPEAVAEIAKQQFENRLERLNRLVALGAPTLMLVIETRLLRRALMLMDPEAVAQDEAHNEHDALRRQHGFCANNACANKLSDVARFRDRMVYCPECEAKFEEEFKNGPNLVDGPEQDEAETAVENTGSECPCGAQNGDFHANDCEDMLKGRLS